MNDCKIVALSIHLGRRPVLKKALNNDLARPMRRSTRINEAIRLKVTGVDSYRGPYCEQVTSDQISCHGCKFKSKFDVLIDSEVMLEVNNEKQGGQPIFARGAVKWTQRPGERDQNGFFYTAVELEEPGDIWGVASPPEDWLQFCQPRKPIRAYVKPMPPVTPSAVSAITAVSGASKVERPSNIQSTLLLPSVDRPLGQFVVAFQKTMEEMLSEAAAAAVRKEATSMRDVLREEAKGIIADAAAAHIEKHSLQLDQLSQSMSARLVEQLRTSVEACRQGAVDRIVIRLKEQLAIPLEDARKVTTNLTKAKEDLEKILGDFAQKTSTRIEASCTRFESQFETSFQEHLSAASTELDRTSQSTMLLTLDNLRVSAKQHEALVLVRLEEALNQVSETVLTAFKEKSAAISCQSAEGLTSYSSRYLEFVGSAIFELAKDLGKQSPLL